MQRRGELTQRVLNLWFQLTGINEDLSVTELRLIPYLVDCAMNSRRLDPNKINSAERKIVSKWRSRNWITGGASSPVRFSHGFWKVAMEILFVAYVDLDEGE